MKRVTLIFILVISSITILAQTKKYYCEVKGIEKELKSGLKIVFDFGNNPVYSAWGGLKCKQKIVDERGEEIPFNSMVDAGNYMSEKGWTFIQAYTSIYGSQAIVHWIFYKEATSPDEAVKGIMTRDEYNKIKMGVR